ncbi:MAG TPA: M23 family metallopeptidase [Pyrinomonadaceae bacterium]|nr:M23 family metallopeptidase [Pyrinomonadaceae bacterium]
MTNFVRVVSVVLVSVQMLAFGNSPTPRKHLDNINRRLPVAMSLDPTGMAKPIADLRDYNGTYYGASGTGTRGYEGGTLYRDNEDNGVTSGCNGEGCGRHPGVDIPVTSGTPVYASLGGTVRISRCGTDGWGGLMVIQAANPWNPSENIYFVYGHLKSRSYSTGQSVLTGAQIGLSGGGSGDPCRGNSTGSHLHFQIDKEDGSPEPYFPSVLNQRDTDFQVTVRTYNPIVFVTGGYRWSFNKPGERELWDITNLQSWGVSNDALWVNGVGDTYISRGSDTNCGQPRPCSSRIAAEANMYPKVYLDLYNVCFNNPGKIYFTTSSSPNWDEFKTVSYFPNSQGPYQAHIFMNQNPLWKDIITGLRIDPAVNCSSGDDPTYYGEITVER